MCSIVTKIMNDFKQINVIFIYRNTQFGTRDGGALHVHYNNFRQKMENRCFASVQIIIIIIYLFGTTQILEW